MPTRFVDAHQIVHELGLYTSIWGVHRAWRRGEIPKPRRHGKRDLWDRQELIEGEPPPPRVIKRRKKGTP